MKKIVKIIASISLATFMLTGCFDSSASKTEQASSTPEASVTASQGTETSTAQATASPTTEDKVLQTLVFAQASDPQKYDPRNMVGLDQRIIANQAFVGLVKFDVEGNIVPAEAESWTVNDDSTVYTFTLRSDLKWSDGTPHTAKDYEYAWKSALNPVFASKTADVYYVIKGAKEYNTNAGERDGVMVKALDDNTLEVTTESSNPFLLEAICDVRFAPVREDVVGEDLNGEAWSMDAATYICNGPFKVSSIKANSHVEYVRNEHYYDAANVKLDELKCVFVPESTTALAAFQTGDIDVFSSIPAIEIEKMIAEGTAQISPMLATYYFSFNVSDMPSEEVREAFGKKEVRHALSLAIDRQQIVDYVTKGGQLPAVGIVPKGIKMPDGSDYTDHKSYLSPTADIEKAKELLANAGYLDGVGFPKFQLFYNTSETHQAIAQAVQDMWKENLGIEIELVNKETKVFAEERGQGKFEMARSGNANKSTLYPTILETFVSESILRNSNDPRFSNDEYDALIKQAMSEGDLQKKLDFYRQAEDIIMEEAPIIPVYFYTNILGVKPDIKDIFQHTSGALFFEYANRE